MRKFLRFRPIIKNSPDLNCIIVLVDLATGVGNNCKKRVQLGPWKMDLEELLNPETVSSFSGNRDHGVLMKSAQSVMPQHFPMLCSSSNCPVSFSFRAYSSTKSNFIQIELGKGVDLISNLTVST